MSDRPGFFSKRSTRRFLAELEAFKPELLHLHNIHGYYLHLPLLFDYIRQTNIPVVWTLHDRWAYTGHCAHYCMDIQDDEEIPTECIQWKTGCTKCHHKHSYPKSWFINRSKKNWDEKNALFSGLANTVLVTPSFWLKQEVQQSFLQAYPTYCIPNGLDLRTFSPMPKTQQNFILKKYNLPINQNSTILLSVASTWYEEKGLFDLLSLADNLGSSYTLILVGVTKQQREQYKRSNLIAIERTENTDDLRAFYAAADLYISLSHSESMGMTLLEALACGTQVLSYNITALPEIITDDVGMTVPFQDEQATVQAVIDMTQHPKDAQACVARAQAYELNARYETYLQLYEGMYHNASGGLRPYHAKGVDPLQTDE